MKRQVTRPFLCLPLPMLQGLALLLVVPAYPRNPTNLLAQALDWERFVAERTMVAL